jgi:hypothetical protein
MTLRALRLGSSGLRAVMGNGFAFLVVSLAQYSVFLVVSVAQNSVFSVFSVAKILCSQRTWWPLPPCLP